jgi:hypothetical protein
MFLQNDRLDSLATEVKIEEIVVESRCDISAT